MVRSRVLFTLVLGGGLIAVTLLSVETRAQTPSPKAQPAARELSSANLHDFFENYCVDCHNKDSHTAGLALDTLDVAKLGANAQIWEKVIGKLRSASMPPLGSPKPDAATYAAVASTLEYGLDRAWASNPNPGRFGAVQRLNRAEYNNAIRDLFALDLDVKPLLPGDDTADGSFDNFADSLSISTAHLERYMSVARQVTRLATGLPSRST